MHRLLSILLLTVLALTCNAETVKQLRNKQRQAKKNIEMTNKLLNENKNSQKNTVSNLTVLKRQIEERQVLINALNDEVGALDRDLSSVSAEKAELESQLEDMRKEYAKLLYHSYFYRTKSNQLFFVLSAESFSQALRRLRYVQEYTRFRKEQALKIQKAAEELAAKEQAITTIKNEKHKTLQGKQVESGKLQQAQASKEQMLKELTSKEKELTEKLQKQQQQITQLNKKIDDMIAAEIAAAERRAKAKAEAERKAREKAAAERKAKEQASKGSKTQDKNSASKTESKTEEKPKAETVPAQSREVTLATGGFENNRGRLPWPVKGVITGRFGLHPHPVLDHVQVNNKGIYIQTTANADATAVYDGEVTQVFSIPGNNNAVIVKHGIYRTVYANLTATYVKVGDKVKARQKIGRVFIDQDSNNKTELYFLLYKESTLQNPELWLAR